MAYVKNAIHLPLDSLLERNGYRLNAQKSTKIWKVYIIMVMKSFL